MLIVLNAKRYYLDIGIYNERGISCGKEVIKWDINILMWHWENL